MICNAIVGVDFDNTIVCYHDIFHRVAVDRRLIDADFPQDKEKIRNYLRQINQENKWIEIQGIVYGKEMLFANSFEGVKNFFETMRLRNIKTYIISHRTKYPYLGEKINLHETAYQWIDRMKFDVDGVFFLESKKEKCEKISICRCTHFIDDLPELLLDSIFPTKVRKILFSEKKYEHSDMITFSSWDDISRYFYHGRI